jgi:hypothetical protein
MDMTFRHKDENGQYVLLSLLKIHHSSWNKESVAAGSCTNTCHINMGLTGIGLLNGPVSVTCAGLGEHYYYCIMKEALHAWMISFPLQRWAL